MKSIATITICLLVATGMVWANAFTVDFYGERIDLEYEPGLVEEYGGNLTKERGIVALYKHLEERPYQSLLRSLQKAKAQYLLNDWLYYQLIEKGAEQACRSNKDHRFRGVLSWMLLAKSGYDARATFTSRDFFLNASTEDELFESPMFTANGESFANLSVVYNKGRMIHSVYGVNFVPNDSGKDFSFALSRHPKLKPRPKSHTYTFTHKGETYHIPARIDQTVVDIMKDYPKFDEIYFVETPLSESSRNTLLPALKREMMGKTQREQMEFLVAFTRRGLDYGSDSKGFGATNRPLTAEEALFYPAVDCEDKVAVLYNLVKELTNLNAVVLAMTDHLSLAVALRQPVGKTISYRGKTYTICDPTGPENTSDIGVFPFDSELRDGEILGEL